MKDWPPSKRLRDHYRWWHVYSTRWGDNDMYGHVNHIIYFSIFDTVVNYFLIKNAGFDPVTSEYIGVTPDSRCCYYESIRYPATVDVGIVVEKIGNSSIIYEIGVFKKDSKTTCAVGHFVHVYVSRNEQNKVVSIPKKITEACRKITT